MAHSTKSRIITVKHPFRKMRQRDGAALISCLCITSLGD